MVIQPSTPDVAPPLHLVRIDVVGFDALLLVIAAACLVVAMRSARRAVVPIGALARALASAALTALVLCVALALIATALPAHERCPTSS
jgi:hypothetical protein